MSDTTKGSETEYFFGYEVTILATTVYILEIIRRFIWNCFKIEVKHIAISFLTH